MVNAILYDASKCIGCRACQVACKRWNELEAEYTEGSDYKNTQELTASTWNVIKYVGIEGDESFKLHFVSFRCMHCLDPVCVAICPVRAIERDPETGAVVTHSERCVGCLMCVNVCPFHVPKFERGVGTRKCTMCIDRQSVGYEPACVHTCPTGALMFGEREEIVRTAQARANEIGGYLYGLEEAGGTCVIMVLTAPPEQLGLPNVEKRSYAEVEAVREVSEVASVIHETSEMSKSSGGLLLAAGLAVVGGLVAFKTKRKQALKATKNEG